MKRKRTFLFDLEADFKFEISYLRLPCPVSIGGAGAVQLPRRAAHGFPQEPIRSSAAAVRSAQREPEDAVGGADGHHCHDARLVGPIRRKGRVGYAVRAGLTTISIVTRDL